MSLAVAPEETRPIERGDRGRQAATRGQYDRDSIAANQAEIPAEEPARLDLPVRAPDDPDAQRRGRNLNMVFDQESGRPIIEIINPRTGEVMDRIPPENLLERAQKEKLPARANLVDETA